MHELEDKRLLFQSDLLHTIRSDQDHHPWGGTNQVCQYTIEETVLF
jgi:hypothetical protein